MLTISKALSSGQAQSYHKLEFTSETQNYYKQGDAVRGEWQGQLAARKLRTHARVVRQKRDEHVLLPITLHTVQRLFRGRPGATKCLAIAEQIARDHCDAVARQRL